MIMLSRWMRGSELKAKATRSTIFTVISFGGENALRLGGNLVLTRLLFPEAFGLMALVQVVINGLVMFSDLGLRPAIIQNKRGGDPAFLNTAWSIQIFRGILLWLLTWALAAPMASFYDEPDLATMLPVAGLTALFAGFDSMKLATASRDLTLGRLTILMLGTNLIGLIVTIGLAVMYKSVWALVIGSLFAPFLKMLLSHVVLSGHRDWPGFEPAAVVELVLFGRYILLSTVAAFLLSYSDRAILGKFTSLTDLALYNIALFMASVPLLLINKIGAEVLFPVLSRTPADRMGAAVAQITRQRTMLNVSIIALSALFIFFGDHLIVFLYDPRYEAAGLLLVLIALAQLPVLIEASYGPMPLAAGHSGRFAVYVTTGAVLRVVMIYLGARYFGIVGVALAPAVAMFLFYPFFLVFLRRYHQWNLRADIYSAGVIALITVMALWLKHDAIAEALTRFGAG